jgi:hypothetical protein
LCAALSFTVLVLGLTDGIDDSVPDNRLWWTLIIAGFAIASACAAVVASHRWEWNSDGISWHGVWRARKLSWPQIRSFGQDWTGNFFVTSEVAGTIRWSTYTYEYQALNEAVAKYRPDLVAARC